MLCDGLLPCPIPSPCARQVAAWGFVAFVLILLAVPVASVLYGLYVEHKQSRTAHEDQLLEALVAMGFADDDDDLYDPYESEAQLPWGASMNAAAAGSGRVRPASGFRERWR